MNQATKTDFATIFQLLTGHAPFPWQTALYDEWFARGKFPRSCDIPTGLGKTSVIAIWYIALMHRPDRMPRRLVYVVNRRTVVDQTTDEVERLRENLSKLDNLPKNASRLAISTLRGQFADNREWSADPSRPAVISGTVDMIGSRLLFSGYRIGFKTRPLHAGFLGQDVLLVHDEAHLEPAFQELVVAIEREQCCERSEQMPWPKLRVMELTATSRRSRAASDETFELTKLEKEPPNQVPDQPTEPIHHVWRRLKAKKGIKFLGARRADLAKTLGQLASARRDSGSAILIFVRTIDDVETVRQVLTEKKEGVPRDHVQVLTGTQRGFQRDQLAREDEVFARFLAEPKVTPKEGTVYLVCTSAGEVGVDISADHMVCDLTTLDRMTQRLGRVNRRGDGVAEIDVVYETDREAKPKSPALESARWQTKEILERLPKCDWSEDRREASPLELMKLQLSDEERKEAFAPGPAILPVTDILFDAWALTTISPPLVRAPLPGRPEVEPYLHGISDWEPPETYVAWREEVEVIRGDLLERYDPEDLLEDYPLKPHELLRDRTDRILKHLQALSREHPEAPLWIVDQRDGVIVTTLQDTIEGNKNAINYATLILPPTIGGITSHGTLNGEEVRKKPKNNGSEANETAEVNKGIPYDVSDRWYMDKDRTTKCRIRLWDDDAAPKGMILEREIRIESRDDEDAEPIKVWRWFVKKPDEASERGRDAYKLHPHLSEVQHCASSIVRRLGLPNDLAQAVILAASCHDLGKKRERWQRNLGNERYPDEVYAKSGRPLRRREFIDDRYRHEFGSVLDLLDPKHPRNGEFVKLSGDVQELTLHLIASHHGRARPHFPEDEAFDPDHDGRVTAALASETFRRFARLQRKYGRWGLAYLESLVRAADYAASQYPGKFAPPSPSTRNVAASQTNGRSSTRNLEPIRISVDATNPGQFLACCGLLELADRLWPGAEGWFDTTAFNLRTESTVREILNSLLDTEPRQLDIVCGDIPVKPIIAPLELRLHGNQQEPLLIDFWMRVAVIRGKAQAISNPPWNFWSGQQTPLRIWLPLRGALKQVLDETSDEELTNVLTLPRPLTGRFGFDSVAAWNALDVGFSPNDQEMAVNTSPASELLSAVGIQRFRPLLSDDRSTISYATWTIPASVLVAPALASLAFFGHGTRYELRVISRGQYGALGHAKPKQGDSSYAYR